VLSVADVLDMAVVRAADPVVLAGGRGLARTVRWVHTTELADIGPLLRGGDLLLTTGIALPDHPAALADFVRSLAESDAVGLFVELGRRWHQVPDTVVAECEAAGLPLVALRREVRFATLTQAVGERLVDEQLAALREAERVHDTFTDLGLAEAGPDEILAVAGRLAGAPVVLEDDRHHVLDYRAGPGDVTEFLDDWERRSQGVDATDERTVWDRSNGWLVTRVGRHERGWGRLVIGSPTEPAQRLVTVAERAAAALAMHQLHDRNRQGRLRRLHHELLLGVLTHPGEADLARRVRLAGLDPDGALVGVCLRLHGPTARLDELVAAYLSAAERHRLPVLVAVFGSDVRALVSVPRRRDPVTCLDEVARDVARRLPVTTTAGTPVTSLAAADRSLREAGQVLEALGGRRGAEVAPGHVHRLEDLHLRGLLALLADDERLRDFTARELAPLRAADPALLETLRVLVHHWGSKSAAAAELNLSRPALYDRLRRIERLVGAPLDDAEVRASLHVALLADGEGPDVGG
jgi:purine catabolism regulator